MAGIQFPDTALFRRLILTGGFSKRLTIWLIRSQIVLAIWLSRQRADKFLIQNLAARKVIEVNFLLFVVFSADLAAEFSLLANLAVCRFYLLGCSVPGQDDRFADLNI